MAEQIRIFKRKAWVRHDGYPGGWKPFQGIKRTVTFVERVIEAQRLCAEHNDKRKRQDELFYEFEQCTS